MYAGGLAGLARFGVERCASNVACADCLAYRDPYCVWRGNACNSVAATSSVAGGDVITVASKCPVGKVYVC